MNIIVIAGFIFSVLAIMCLALIASYALMLLFGVGAKGEIMTNPRIYHIGGGWGDAIQWTDYNRGRVHGWKTLHPRIGDLLHAPMQSGKTGVFQFVAVELCRDPPDMFFAEVTAIGYTDGSKPNFKKLP